MELRFFDSEAKLTKFIQGRVYTRKNVYYMSHECAAKSPSDDGSQSALAKLIFGDI